MPIRGKDEIRTKVITSVLKKISPVAWQHINLYGRYEFRKCAQLIDLEDIVHQLTQSPPH